MGYFFLLDPTSPTRIMKMAKISAAIGAPVFWILTVSLAAFTSLSRFAGLIGTGFSLVTLIVNGVTPVALMLYLLVAIAGLSYSFQFR